MFPLDFLVYGWRCYSFFGVSPPLAHILTILPCVGSPRVRLRKRWDTLNIILLRMPEGDLRGGWTLALWPHILACRLCLPEVLVLCYNRIIYTFGRGTGVPNRYCRPPKCTMIWRYSTVHLSFFLINILDLTYTPTQVLCCIFSLQT